MNFDRQMMRRCFELGKIAQGRGDAPVGSIVISNGEIVAEGIESVKSKNDPTAHAEIEAVRLACGKLKTLELAESVLYTNIEPCWMCSYAIRQTRISRIVIADPNEIVGGFSSKFRVLTDETLKMPLPRIDFVELPAERGCQ